MRELKCTNCGAPINPKTMRCEYCGTQYKIDNEQIVRIETFQNPCKVYKSQMIIPDEHVRAIGENEMSRIAIRQLSQNLADAIAENMELTYEHEPMSMAHRCTARVRIVEPKYTF